MNCQVYSMDSEGSETGEEGITMGPGELEMLQRRWIARGWRNNQGFKTNTNGKFSINFIDMQHIYNKMYPFYV